MEEKEVVEEEDCYFVMLIVIRVIMQIIDSIITIIICREGPRVGRIVARLRRFSAQALARGSFRSACAVLCLRRVNHQQHGHQMFDYGE